MPISNFENTLLDYCSDYEEAKSLGAAMLACNSIIVPEIAPNIALLIANFPRPMTTYTDPVEYAYAGGLQAHRPGVPKTSHTGQLQFIETDFGQIAGFAEILAANGGQTNCIVYDGRRERYTASYYLQNCAITLEAGENDAEGRNTIMRHNGPMSYMYFGQNAELGTASKVGQIIGSNTAMNGFLQKSKSILSTVQAGNTLLNALGALG